MLRNFSIKAFVAFVAFMLACAGVSSKQIVTQYGETFDVVVPEGMTAEDAFYDMAKLYKEEKHDREGKQAELDSVTKAYDAYKEAERKSNEARDAVDADNEKRIADRDIEINALKKQVSDLNNLVDDYKRGGYRIFAYGTIYKGMEAGSMARYGFGGGLTFGYLMVQAGMTFNPWAGQISIGFIL